jgi:hypothetical protein
MKYLDNEAEVRIVQTSKNRWQIETQSGFILQSDITVSSPREAENFIKDYISSYRCWTYKVVPLEEK